jgi:hypothetical protein
MAIKTWGKTKVIFAVIEFRDNGYTIFYNYIIMIKTDGGGRKGRERSGECIVENFSYLIQKF